MIYFLYKSGGVYILKIKRKNQDESYFGTSVPHIFLKTFKETVVLPQRIFNYVPKIHGFNLYNKTELREWIPKIYNLLLQFISLLSHLLL